jgi:hypothetical protein
MTAFTTPSSKSRPSGLLRGLALGLLLLASALAGAAEIEVRRAELSAGEESWLLDAEFGIDLGQRLEEVVARGVALYFVAEFELTKGRWYWVDEHVAGRKQTWRLSYNALTRQYRLSSGALHQSFASLDEALRRAGPPARMAGGREGAAEGRRALQRGTAPQARPDPAAEALPGHRHRQQGLEHHRRSEALELQPAARHRHGRPGQMRWVLFISAALAAILLFLLTSASANTALFAGQYRLLLGVTAAVAAILLGLVLWQLRQLWREHRAEVFGSRLKLRLMLMFALMAVVPGALVYAVSLQFAVKSIESWFDVRVDKALEGGLNLGRSALDYLLADLTDKARAMALELGEASAAPRSRA